MLNLGALQRVAAIATLSAVFTGCSQTSTRPMPIVPASSQSFVARVSPHWSRVSLATFADPYGVAVDPRCSANCDVYVADPGSKRIWKVSPNGAKRVIGDFSGAGISFDPQSVAFDLESGLYVADKGGRLWLIDLRNGATHVIYDRNPCNGCPGWWRGVGVSSNIHGGPGGTAFFAWANHGLFGASGDVFYRDSKGGIVKPGLSPQDFDPYGVAGDGKRNAYFADARGKKIWVTPGASGLFYDFSSPMKLVDPYGVAVTWDGQYCYVADAGAKKVYEKSPDGSWSEVGAFTDPYGVAVDAGGTVYVADPGSRNVWKLTR